MRKEYPLVAAQNMHYRFGSEYPKDLADFEKVLESDLKKAGNEKRFANPSGCSV